MIKALVISIIAIVNAVLVYWVVLFLFLLDNSANGLLVPNFVFKTAPVGSLVLRWFIVLIEALLIFAGLGLVNFAILERIELSNSEHYARILFIVEVFVAMSFITYLFVSIAISSR